VRERDLKDEESMRRWFLFWVGFGLRFGDEVRRQQECKPPPTTPAIVTTDWNLELKEKKERN